MMTSFTVLLCLYDYELWRNLVMTWGEDTAPWSWPAWHHDSWPNNIDQHESQFSVQLWSLRIQLPFIREQRKLWGNCEETVRKPTNKPLVNHLISDLQQLNHFRSHQLLFMTTMEKMLVMMCLVVVTQTTEKNEFLMRFNTTDAEQDTRQALCCWLFLLISL